jgi:hypothetical protein
VTTLLGVSLHDPDVVFTDLGLAILGGYLAWRLWRAPDGGPLLRSGAVLMGGLASAALWGAIFHAFFPAGTTTIPGYLVWAPVSLSIVVAATTMLALALRLLVPRLPPGMLRALALIYSIGFAAVALMVDQSFRSIVCFYVPALLLLLVAAAREAIRNRSAGWGPIALGLLISAGAAVLQQLRVSIHPVYFDHNAVYHVVQVVALLVLYLGWRRLSEPRPTNHPR